MLIKALLPLIAGLIGIAGFRMAVHRVVDEATKPSTAIPVSTPFVSPLCPDVQKCTFQFDQTYPGQQKPFRGLQYP